MGKRGWVLVICLSGFCIRGTGQELSALHIDRGSLYQQLSPEVIELVGTLIPGEPSWYFQCGASLESGSINNARIAGPGFPQGFPMEYYMGEEGIEYDYETSFLNEADLRAFSPAGEYAFTGSGSGIGPFTETITLGELTPLAPKRITNFDALQSIDPAQPFVIEWEPFSDAGDGMAFIEVDIIMTTEWGTDEIWESPEEEGSFGLDPAATSVEVPAGVLSGWEEQSFEVVVFFARIEDLVMGTVFGGGIKGYVTGVETTAHIRLQQPEGRVVLLPMIWQEDACFGWLYGISPEWGYSYDLGFVWLGQTPNYIYQYPMGWLAHGGGTMRNGCWFHAPLYNWIFTVQGYGGWYQSLDGSWHHMLGP